MIDAEQAGVLVVGDFFVADPVVDVGIARPSRALRIRRHDGGERCGDARPVRGTRHRPCEAPRLALPDALVIDEEERALRHDRPADVDPELVQRERRHVADRAERTRVEPIVADEVEDRAAILVGAGLGDQLHDAAGGRAGLGRVERRTDAEFRDRFAADDQPRIAVLPRILDARRIDAVERPVVVVARPAHEPGAQVGAFASVDGAGCQQHQARPVTAGERQIFQLAGLNDRSDRCGRPIEERRDGFHVDDFGDLSDLHLEVEAEALTDLKPHVSSSHTLETRQFGGNLVLAGGQEVEDVHAGGVGDDVARQAGCGRLQLDGHTREDGAARIGHGAVQRRSAGLRLGARRIAANESEQED